MVVDLLDFFLLGFPTGLHGSHVLQKRVQDEVHWVDSQGSCLTWSRWLAIMVEVEADSTDDQDDGQHNSRHGQG